MISTLNPKIDKLVVIISLISLAYFVSFNKLSIVTFVLGFSVSFPVAIEIWKTMEKNWKNVYKKFYLMNFYNRDWKIALQSWKLVWWIIPATIIIYGPLSFAIMHYSADKFLLESCIMGSIAATAWVTSQKSGKYYKEIEREKNE